MDQDWFEMHDVRRRWLNRFVWIPLRSTQVIEKAGEFGYEGYLEEFYGIGTLAVYSGERDISEKLDWMDIGINHEHGPYYDENVYAPVDAYFHHSEKILGKHLVLEQNLNVEECSEWHLHQDLVFALGLKRETDIWICPKYNYVEVAKLKRDSIGKPVLLEIKAEFLRDYLCACKMALRATTYRSRIEIIASAGHIDWPNGRKSEGSDNDRWEGLVRAIHEGGMPFGGETAVIHMGRTDVYPEDDVPSFDFPTDDKVSSKSFIKKSTGDKLFYVRGELYRNEWIEPGEHSYIVKGDKRPATVHFITDESGKKETQETLIDSSKWLWFKPEVMMTLAHRRGGALGWYTRDTGSIRCSPGYSVHFGVNKLGLITVFAKDIGMLPEWQQQIWAGYNITPEGGVSEELLASQMRADPARTLAPEAFLKRELERLDFISQNTLGSKLFRDHEQFVDIIEKCHRFRAVDQAGLYALAKDLTRIITDRIDIQLLRKIANPPKGENWGSLKLLEKVLASIIDAADARNLLSPIAGIYELRLADAHLKSTEVEEAYKLVGIDSNLPSIQQGYRMLYSCVSCINIISEILEDKSKTVGD